MAHGNWAYFYQDHAEGLGRADRMGEAMPLYEQAIEQYRGALTIKPDDYGSIYNMGVCLLRLRRPAEAVEKFREVVHINPIHIDALESLAWYLSTTRDDKLRSPSEAVNYGQRAVALSGDRGDYDMKLESLAAAYAANRQFGAAVKIQQQAMDAAHRLGKDDALNGLAEKLALYKAGIDYRGGD